MSTERKQRFEEFVAWFDKHITGDEKGEGQIFLERFLQSFGNKVSNDTSGLKLFSPLNQVPQTQTYLNILI